MKVDDVRFKVKIKGIKELGKVFTIQYYTDCDEMAELQLILPFTKEIQKDLHKQSYFYHIDYDYDYIGVTVKVADVEALLPYTGFKDKNGEEIYEGDILELSNGVKKFNGETCNKLVVCLHEGRFLATNNIETIGNVIGGGVGLKNIIYKNKVKIIGNCFENPELLKKGVN